DQVEGDLDHRGLVLLPGLEDVLAQPAAQQAGHFPRGHGKTDPRPLDRGDGNADKPALAVSDRAAAVARVKGAVDLDNNHFVAVVRANAGDRPLADRYGRIALVGG